MNRSRVVPATGRAASARLAACLVAALPGSTPAAALSPLSAAAVSVPDTTQAVRFFFVADGHSRHGYMQRFLAEVQRERPGLIIDGGDIVHDGTEPEFVRAFSDRASAGVPWHIARGNHDAVLRGRFEGAPPEFPAFAGFDHGGIRFIMLDNHAGVLDDAQFDALEADLAARPGGRFIVVLHVPPFLDRERTIARLRRLLPFPLEDPAMTDAAQVERFTDLMERHRVLAVLTGHTHAPADMERGGVRYIVAGAMGGLTPGMNIPNEYLDVVVDGRAVRVTRVTLQPPPGNPVTFVARAFRFYTDLNGFNHRHLGWTYIPSASVQLRTGLGRIQSGGGERPVLSATASFERVLADRGMRSFYADAGLFGGRRDAALTLAGGLRWRPVGSYNRNAYAAVGPVGNAGVVGDRWTAGVGAQAAIGVEWRTITIELGTTRATNHRAAAFTAGRRF